MSSYIVSTTTTIEAHSPMGAALELSAKLGELCPGAYSIDGGLYSLEEFEGYLDEMIPGYIKALLWAETAFGAPEAEGNDQWDTSFESYGCTGDELSGVSRLQCHEDCKAFLTETWDLRDGWTADDFGADFWFTRQGHGTGFWDRGRENGDSLTRAAENYNSLTPYLHEGRIYF